METRKGNAYLRTSPIWDFSGHRKMGLLGDNRNRKRSSTTAELKEMISFAVFVSHTPHQTQITKTERSQILCVSHIFMCAFLYIYCPHFHSHLKSVNMHNFYAQTGYFCKLFFFFPFQFLSNFVSFFLKEFYLF